jgi:hypothetical protein
VSSGHGSHALMVRLFAEQATRFKYFDAADTPKR